MNAPGPRGRGLLIVVEGLDGTGKTTASRALARHLGAAWMTTPGAELREVRDRFDAAFSQDPVARSLAYGASVLEVGTRAARLRDEGQTVVIDRYWPSTLAYAPPAARPALEAMEPCVVRPDRVFFLDAADEVRRARMQARGMSEADRQTLDPAQVGRLRQQYRDALGRLGEAQRIDASGGAGATLAALVQALQRPSLGPLFDRWREAA